MSQKPRPKSHLLPVADVLQSLLAKGKSQLADGFSRWRLEQKWPEIVGESLAAESLPVAYEKGTLFIWVRHSTWIQQLWSFQDLIREKVNEHVGYKWVVRVKFTLNRRAAVASEKVKEL